MKRFLKEAGGIDQYPDVKIEWIFHHNPDLFVFQDGKQLQSIDLSRYDYEGLHTLFKQHFRTSGAFALEKFVAEALVRRGGAVDEQTQSFHFTHDTRANVSYMLQVKGAAPRRW